MSKLVSIITPCFNSEKFISETILSIKNQTYQNWELIIVDDCSTDKSVAIINEYIKEIFNVTDISRWCSRKTITENVLNPERTNEQKILDAIGEDTLVIDVGSTKLPICDAIANHMKRRNFMATHPIAGTEFSGPSAAIKDLFQDKTNIICEVEKTTFKLQEKALELFKSMGMRIRYMDPKSHDKHISYVSHLSHISAFMLGKTVVEKEKDELSSTEHVPVAEEVDDGK